MSGFLSRGLANAPRFKRHSTFSSRPNTADSRISTANSEHSTFSSPSRAHLETSTTPTSSTSPVALSPTSDEIADSTDTGLVQPRDAFESSMDEIDRLLPRVGPRSRYSVHMHTLANLHSMSQAMLASTSDIPVYIRAKSANKIISESRPTRIQAEALSFVNRMLDELLFFIVASARSLATDRIKTDGILKVLNNNVLAKDAILEAELELRKYLDSKKAEGGRVPLGLMSTSKWDGTAAFPIANAYRALRSRCLYYTTLGERTFDTGTGDQNIMSSEGKPVATLTPGVSIYVTALIEYVGQYVLKNVAAVIERDNSDEASIADLKAAVEEDEMTITLWRQMVVKQEVEKRVAAQSNGSRVTKPWQVPDQADFDQAATPTFRGRPNTATGSGPSAWAMADRIATHSAMDSKTSNRSAGSMEFVTSPTNEAFSPTLAAQHIGASPNPSQQSNSRRASMDKGFGGFLRRKTSFKGTTDSAVVPMNRNTSSSSSGQNQMTISLNDETSDDFDAVMMSGQTMKVSLTPNRLRTIEIAEQNARQRLESLSISNLRAEGQDILSPKAGSMPPLPTATLSPSSPIMDESTSRSVSPSPTARRTQPRKSNPPPSSYRGIDSLSPTPGMGRSASAESAQMPPDFDADGSPQMMRKTASTGARLQSRDKRASWAPKEMMELFNSVPPSAASPTLSQRGSADLPPAAAGRLRTGSSPSLMGRLRGSKVKGLLGRRSNTNSQDEEISFRSTSSQSKDDESFLSSDFSGSVGSPRSQRSRILEEEPQSTSTDSVSRSLQAKPSDFIRSPTPASDAGLSGNEETSRTPRLSTKLLPPPPPQEDSVEMVASTESAEHRASPTTPSSMSSSKDISAGAQKLVGLFEEDVVPVSKTVAPVVVSTPSRPASTEPMSVGGSGRRLPFGRRASQEFAARANNVRSSSGAHPPVSLDRASSALGFTSSRSHAGEDPSSPPHSGRPMSLNVASPVIVPPSPSWASFSGPSSSAGVLRTLAILDRRMRSCVTAEECRALVSEALSTAFKEASQTQSPLAEHPSGRRSPMTPSVASFRGSDYFGNGIPSQTDLNSKGVRRSSDGFKGINSYSRSRLDSTGMGNPRGGADVSPIPERPSPAATTAHGEPIAAASPPKTMPRLVMLDSYDAQDPVNWDAAAVRDNGVIVGWLLDESPDSPLMQSDSAQGHDALDVFGKGASEVETPATSLSSLGLPANGAAGLQSGSRSSELSTKAGSPAKEPFSSKSRSGSPAVKGDILTPSRTSNVRRLSATTSHSSTQYLSADEDGTHETDRASGMGMETSDSVGGVISEHDGKWAAMSVDRNRTPVAKSAAWGRA